VVYWIVYPFLDMEDGFRVIYSAAAAVPHNDGQMEKVCASNPM